MKQRVIKMYSSLHGQVYAKQYKKWYHLNWQYCTRMGEFLHQRKPILFTSVEAAIKHDPSQKPKVEWSN